jgi:TPP-dependent pyruvate/acetoin dehydrogenase alpha subunit
MQEWRARDPVTRFQAFLSEGGWWDAEQEKGLRVAVRKEVRDFLVLQ